MERHIIRTSLSTTALLLTAIGSCAAAAGADIGVPGQPRWWGNGLYVDLAVGDTFAFMDKEIKLVSMDAHFCEVQVDGVGAELKVARRCLPEVINGVRVFVADNENVDDLTTDGKYLLIHAATTRDALLCLSDPAKPLLDPQRFCFPIRRSDGYAWSMQEDSHMFAFLHPIDSNRSHEGIDFDMREARGKKMHAVVAVEDAYVRWVDGKLSGPNQACILLESKTQPGIYYVYKHLYDKMVYAFAGDTVTKGRLLGYIWGDEKWGHLHFAVVGYGAVPDYEHRYRYLLNCFPQMYELYHGNLKNADKTYTAGDWSFGRWRWLTGNIKRLDAYNPLVGYGWVMGKWNPTQKVEYHRGQNAVLRKTLFRNHTAAATNPRDFYEFEIAVPDGCYNVKARVGCKDAASWQKIVFEDIFEGTHALSAGEFAWTQRREVVVEDGRLTIGINLKDDQTCAGLAHLEFCRQGK